MLGSRVPQGAFERLDLHEWKRSRTVLGEGVAVTPPPYPTPGGAAPRGDPARFFLEDFADAWRQLGRFLEDVDKRERIHSALGCLTPAEVTVHESRATSVQEGIEPRRDFPGASVDPTNGTSLGASPYPP
jgi:hypothetical protein